MLLQSLRVDALFEFSKIGESVVGGLEADIAADQPEPRSPLAQLSLLLLEILLQILRFEDGPVSPVEVTGLHPHQCSVVHSRSHDRQSGRAAEGVPDHQILQIEQPGLAQHCRSDALSDGGPAHSLLPA